MSPLLVLTGNEALPARYLELQDEDPQLCSVVYSRLL